MFPLQLRTAGDDSIGSEPGSKRAGFPPDVL